MSKHRVFACRDKEPGPWVVTVAFSSKALNHLDDISWVRKVNARWIVRQTLREDTANYLDYLAEEDPERLHKSCWRARHLQSLRPPNGDPKPWFYSGLFSLIRKSEAQRYLPGHDFTIACILGGSDFGIGTLDPSELSPETAEKIHRIREAIASLEE